MSPEADDTTFRPHMICHRIEAVVRNVSHAVNTVNLTEQSFRFF